MVAGLTSRALRHSSDGPGAGSRRGSDAPGRLRRAVDVAVPAVCFDRGAHGARRVALGEGAGKDDTGEAVAARAVDRERVFPVRQQVGERAPEPGLQIVQWKIIGAARRRQALAC